MENLTLLSYIIFFLGAVAAGFIDSIAGGGGMVTIPILLSMGIPPHLALGTNKLQAAFGSTTSTLRYRKSKLFRLRDVWPGIIFTFIGAMSGTLLIQSISADFLEKAVPLLLAAIFIYTIIKKDLGDVETHSRLKKLPFLFIFGLLIGFYDGFFGPGTGSFWAIAFVTLMGMNLKSATAATKPMNLTSNLTSLAFFIVGGNVIITIGLVMGAGQIVGNYIGSHLVIKKQPKFVRYALLIIVGITIVKTFYDSYL